jgi:hypothetical protein
MSPNELLQSLISYRWDIFNQHSEMEGDAFSITGCVLHVWTGKMYNFDFHIMPDGGHYVLDIIEKN